MTTAILSCAASTARAQPAADDDARASASLHIYSDNDHMTVVSPRAGAQAPIGEGIVVDTNITADIISGASVDVVSEASPQALSERRLEGGLGISLALGQRLTSRARITGSTENDYTSIGGELATTLELAQRNTVLDLSIYLGMDSVGRTGMPEFHRKRRTQRAIFTMTQAIDPRMFVDVVLEAIRDHGYLESAYRTVPIIDPSSSAVLRAAEQVPETRLAGAGMVRIRRAITRALFAHAAYRHYRDDWSVTSHTGTLTVLLDATTRLRLGTRARLYHQSAADFYQARYTLLEGNRLPTLRTRERRLGTMTSIYGGITGDVAISSRDPDDHMRLIGGVGLMRFWWPDFPAQTQRDAIVLTLGLTSPL